MRSTIGDPATIAKKLHVPTYDEILERIRAKYPRGGKTLLDKQLATIQRTYDITISKTNFVRDLVQLLDNLHPFYWKLIEIEFNKPQIHRAISCISKARRLSSRIYEKYRFLLLASENRRELLSTASEARGRILSLFKKCRRELEYLRNLVIFIQKLPGINASEPVIIVAGPPSSGKSTFVRNVSRAKPKVAPYPFTTTSIHIGHIDINNKKIQVIDTPGLLDRPIDEMNIVERKAVAALTELNGIILFLLDVSIDAYMPIQRQIKLLINISSLAQGKNIVAGINKVDIAHQAYLAIARESLKELVTSGTIKEIVEFTAINKEECSNIARKLYLKYFEKH